MDDYLDINLLIAIVFGIFILYFLARILIYPFRASLRVLAQLGVGVLVLIIFNLVASHWDFSLGVNPVTGLVAGVLGIPGLVMLILVQLII